MLEGVFQNIPTFVFNYGKVDFKSLPEELYFASSDELLDKINRVNSGSMRDSFKKIREYLCGPDNIAENYRRFFNGLGWE